MADSDRVWELMKKISICMFATWDGRELHARPMGAYVRREDNAVYFLGDAGKPKDAEVEQYSKVCLAFADIGGQKYVSVAGHAEVTNDRAKIKELWGTPAKVTPTEAEYWDAPGTTVAYIKMATAAMTGHRPDMGETRKVAMR